MRCHTCKAGCEKPMRCSQCHNTVYCSVQCQKADWKVHKRSTCVKPSIFHQVDKMMNRFSGPGTALGFMNRIEEEAWTERRTNPTPIWACDGCFRRFRGAPPKTPGPFDDEDAGDAGDRFKHCTDCDWTICKDCTEPGNQGIPYFDRPPGTCRCAASNFGVSYCLIDPSYLHGDGRKQYQGDRHPRVTESVYNNDAFERKERPCKTCGVIARCLRKEHRKDAAPGIIQ